MGSGRRQCSYLLLSKPEPGGGGRLKRCERPAKVVREGSPFCGQHDPAAVRASVDAILGDCSERDRARIREAVCDGVGHEQLAGIAVAGGLAAMLGLIGVLAGPASWVERVKATAALVDIAAGKKPEEHAEGR